MSESGDPSEANLPDDFGDALSSLGNADPLAALDLVVLELAKRLLRYAQ